MMPDVSILVYAHRTNEEHHDTYGRWLADPIGSSEAAGSSRISKSG